MNDISNELALLRARIDELQADLQRVKAKDQIIGQIVRYGRGEDWLDPTLMQEVLHDEAHIDVGIYVGRWKEWLPQLMELEASYATTFHSMGLPQIELTSDHQAHSETYVTGGIRTTDGSTSIYGARFYDIWEKRDGVWKISSRIAKIDWTMDQSINETEGGDSLSGPCGVGVRSTKNPLFRRMGVSVT